MKMRTAIVVLGTALTLLIVVPGGNTQAAQPPTSISAVYNKVLDIYNYLVNTINPKLDSISSTAVSTELGMLSGVYLSGSQDEPDSVIDIATVGTLGELARYTVTVSFIQGDADDSAVVYLSQDGLTISPLFELQPGAGGRTVQSSTVVATHIILVATNTNPNWPGAESSASISALSWSVSAVGKAGTPELTVYPAP